MKNLKYLICFILGGIIFSSVGVIADTVMNASGIMYNDKTVGSALDDLYSKIDEINNTGDASSSDILSGKTALVKGNLITGTIPSYADDGYYYVGTDVGYINSSIFLRFPAGAYLKTNTTGFVETWTEAKNIGLTADKIAKGQSVAGIEGTYTSSISTFNDITSTKQCTQDGYVIYALQIPKQTAGYTVATCLNADCSSRREETAAGNFSVKVGGKSVASRSFPYGSISELTIVGYAPCSSGVNVVLSTTGLSVTPSFIEITLK